ncbi:cyclically-permuted mutarotase family protein [Selenomonas sp. oral taxon 136]|uniref:cyclically-permuted mutarotase family protein n=1 Tax=Selenomonas sp. oral taxon 136 TaxID=713030 RepID=UPI000767F680|nr:cyclically-permuted mutarotase family protein [Selenomonas sp. oral taxon 136]AME03587.1 mutarotase [Selenomonas sp. oral taxon 136]
MKRLWNRTALAALVALAPLSAAAAPAAVGSPALAWQSMGTLSPAEGQKENIGVAGLLQGTFGDYIIVGGGANFPAGGPLTGGAKVTYPDVYVLRAAEAGLTETDHAQMPYPVGYGVSATTPDGVLYFGGSTDESGARAVTRLTAPNGKLRTETLPALPFALQNGVAAYDKDTVYLGGGKQDGVLSKKFYTYDIKTGTLTSLPDFPGEAREQSVAEFLGGRFFVFSGGANVAYTDGYAYDPKAQTWMSVAGPNVNGTPVSLLGARAVRLNADEMLVVGGFNREIYDWAVSNLNTLQGEEKDAFRAHYFTMPPEDYHWNREILVYSAKADAWRSVGQLPFPAPCGEALVIARGALFSISGEVKPGVRSPRLYRGLFVK